jgi:fructose/tagatose bisphosphate aldolase
MRMNKTPLDRLLESLSGIVVRQGDRVAVPDPAALAARMDALVREAVFGDALTKPAARWIIYEAAQALGVRPASINAFYRSEGREAEAPRFTVPAINLRMVPYDAARAVFRAARKIDAGAFIFEIARSEIGYTDQRPAEYTAVLLAAALKEGFRGPVFIQGDHFQISAKKYAVDPESELKAIRDLIVESLTAGFYNIDIDTSTLVDLDQPTLAEQQRLNSERCAEFTAFIRGHQPPGVAVSIGGEIGEVGLKNSSPEDLEAFMAGYDRMRGAHEGISKISIQTGTSHGGVVLADGTLAQVAIDFGVLRLLSREARLKYGMGGAVQHGASTLPETAFHKFVEAGTCEVHLATAFQSLVMDHPAVPEGLRREMIEWLKVHAADERKPKDSEAQFIYKARKKAVGPFKKHFWSLPADTLEAIGADLEKTFTFLFGQLNIAGTAKVVARTIQAPEIHRPAPQGAEETAKHEHVDGLAD